jgi:hypothetical protein
MHRSTLFLLPVALFACTESVESTDVRTSGIYPEFRVVADGSGNSQVSARLKVGGNDSNTFLDLRDADRLEVSVGEDTRRLDETSAQRYTASFPIDAAGTEFVFTFIRGADDAGAPRSIVTLPEPFELQMSTTEASRAADGVAFNWDPPSSGSLRWDMEGDCVWDEGGATPDDGSHNLDREQVRARANDEAKSCTVDLTVDRSLSGSVDPAFTEGGESTAYQSRTRSFTSIP